MRHFNGKRLRTLREDRGLSRHILSLKTGLQLKQICRWETAQCVPRWPDQLMTLATALGVTVDDLYTEAEEAEA